MALLAFRDVRFGSRLLQHVSRDGRPVGLESGGSLQGRSVAVAEQRRDVLRTGICDGVLHGCRKPERLFGV